MGVVGLEPTHKTPDISHDSESRGTESGTVAAESSVSALAKAIAGLSDDARAKLVAMLAQDGKGAGK